jgi:hypothetical protein
MMLLLAGSAAAQPRPSPPEAQERMAEPMALLAREWMRMKEGELVIKAQPLARTVTQLSNVLRLVEATSYQVIVTRREARVMRLLLEMRIENMGRQPWTPRQVELSAQGEALKVARLGEPRPIAPGQEGVVLVEALVTEARAQGTFTLTLSDESGDQFITLGRVTFP